MLINYPTKKNADNYPISADRLEELAQMYCPYNLPELFLESELIIFCVDYIAKLVISANINNVGTDCVIDIEDAAKVNFPLRQLIGVNTYKYSLPLFLEYVDGWEVFAMCVLFSIKGKAKKLKRGGWQIEFANPVKRKEVRNG